ncbi:MAG: hypothetical protein F6J93_27720 [Oscillatoria sp. SIO1A7]|nr:hypothetical protein [Oscillatoria sp. SIO1A7]
MSVASLDSMPLSKAANYIVSGIISGNLALTADDEFYIAYWLEAASNYFGNNGLLENQDVIESYIECIGLNDII